MINSKLKKVYEIELNYLGIPVYDESEFFKLFNEKNISFYKFDSNHLYRNKYFNQKNSYSKFFLMLNYICQ